MTKTNQVLQSLVQELKKQAIEQKVGFWKRLALDLERPTRQRRAVNIFTLDQSTKDNETVVVPGKVLASGALSHKVNVAAWSFSEQAKEKIQKANGTCISLKELMKKNPTGKDVRIIG